jgi:hypothetical protein
MEGDLEHRRAVAGQGPAAQPATVAVVVHTDHLIKLLARGRFGSATAARRNRRRQPLWESFGGERFEGVGSEPDAAALLEIHGWTARGLGFLSIPTASWVRSSPRTVRTVRGDTETVVVIEVQVRAALISGHLFAVPPSEAIRTR